VIGVNDAAWEERVPAAERPVPAPEGAVQPLAQLWDPGGQFEFYAARPSSRRARWLVRCRSRGVPVQNASSRRRLSAQAMYTWSSRVLGRGSGRVARRGWRPSAWCLRRRRGGRSRLGRESSLPQSGRRPGLWPGRGAAARAVVVCRRCTGRGPGRAAVAGGEGDGTGVLMTRTPLPASTWSNVLVNLLSRSRIRNLKRPARSPRSRSRSRAY
jgi:hypothetical protein